MAVEHHILSIYLNFKIIFLFFFIAAFIILYFFVRSSRKRVIILGLSGSGKTCLFLRLVHGLTKDTHTSMTENTGQIIRPTRMQIIDCPGNEKVRQKYYNNYKNSSNGIIFVIDSNTIHIDIRDVAEFLYILLTDPVIKSSCKQFLILCNKQDMEVARGTGVVKSMLEKELRLLKDLKKNELETTDSYGSTEISLGYKQKLFEFSHCKPLNVEFAASTICSESEDKVDTDEVHDWLKKI